MSLKKDFTISNLIMLFVPVLIIGCAVAIVFLYMLSKYMQSNLAALGSNAANPIDLIYAVKTLIGENPSAVKIVMELSLFSLIVIFFVTTLITHRLSKNVLLPIESLKAAAKNIESGDLDEEVLSCKYEEISQLCVEFDNMRKRLKESRMKENRMNEERKMLLAHMSHDLKTPITAIMGYAQGLQDGIAATPEMQKRYIDTIIAKAEILQNLAENLSEYSHLELNKTGFYFRKGDYCDFISEAVDCFAADFEKVGIRLVKNIPTGAVEITADFEKLFRVFSNIFDNALKYRKADSKEIRVSVSERDGGVYTTIVDDGIGIKASEIESVFDDFYRVNEARTMNVKGNGLGLGIARLIVEKHRGKIWLSPSDCGGTCVTVYLGNL